MTDAGATAPDSHGDGPTVPAEGEDREKATMQGYIDSLREKGYEQAKNEALNAILELKDRD